MEIGKKTAADYSAIVNLNFCRIKTYQSVSVYRINIIRIDKYFHFNTVPDTYILGGVIQLQFEHLRLDRTPEAGREKDYS